jgi:hypothetical protein
VLTPVNNSWLGRIILSVGRTRKDSKQISNTVLELVAKSDETFDTLWDGKLDRAGIPERWLNEDAALAFTGKDTAAGKSWEAWMKKYGEKKAAGEKNIGLEPEALE